MLIVNTLREQAKVLRDLAARPTANSIQGKLLALAGQCEELAHSRTKALLKPMTFRRPPGGSDRTR